MKLDFKTENMSPEKITPIYKCICDMYWISQKPVWKCKHFDVYGQSG